MKINRDRDKAPMPSLPAKGQVFKDGEPCTHPGCLSHVSHPCEGCGRIGGYRVTKPRCPRCDGDRLRRDTQRIPSKKGSRHYATGSWYVCLDVDCGCCFDGVTDRDDGLLPWWVEKRAAGTAAQGELPEEETECTTN